MIEIAVLILKILATLFGKTEKKDAKIDRARSAADAYFDKYHK
jgi:hypothetical protein